MFKTKNGFIQTVTGQIDPQQMGITLSHEHCLIDNTAVFTESDNDYIKQLAKEPITVENAGFFRYHLLNNKSNLLLDDEKLAIYELSKFKARGGQTIADASIDDLGRDPTVLKNISLKTGLNIIMGSGYYVETPKLLQKLKDASAEMIADEIINDICKGVGTTEVHAGFIGEIGCSWPLTKLERTVLKGAAIAQKKTGAGLQVHPGRNPRAPFEILSILEQSGADIEKTAICHIERTIDSDETLLELASTGCYLEYDLIGFEGYYPEDFALVNLPNDAARIDQFKKLIDNGFAAKILASYDICYKCRYSTYGGHGYAHLLDNFVPSMRKRGIEEGNIEKILISNPSRFFTMSC